MGIPRVTTSQLMVSIAVIGVSLGVYRLVTRRIAYRQAMAMKHQDEVRDDFFFNCFGPDEFSLEICPRCGKALEGSVPSSSPVSDASDEVVHSAGAWITPNRLPPDPKKDYHDTMMHKWLRGASRPWLEVSPDPPEPK